MLRAAVLAVIAAFAPAPAWAADCGEWEWLNPSPSAQSYNDAVLAGDVIAAVGSGGLVAFGSTPPRLSRNRLDPPVDLNGIAWNGSRLVVVGADGTIRTSTDQEHWEAAPSPVTSDLLDVAWLGARFVAVGLEGAVLTSPDGVSWTRHELGITNDLRSVACRGGTAIAIVTSCSGRPSWGARRGGPWWSARTARSLPRAARSRRLHRWRASSPRLRWPGSRSASPTPPLTRCRSTGGCSMRAGTASASWPSGSGSTCSCPAAARPSRPPPTGSPGRPAASAPGPHSRPWRRSAAGWWRWEPGRAREPRLAAWPSSALMASAGRSTISEPAARSWTWSRPATYPDVVGQLLGVNGIGALRITPVQGSVVVSSRTFNQLGDGTRGQSIPGLPVEAATRQSEQVWLVGLRRSADPDIGMRTNIGVASATSTPIDVVIDLLRADGTLLGTRTLSLAPYEHRQVSDALDLPGIGEVELGAARVHSPSPGTAYFAYASITDNRSGDPIFVPGAPAR